MNETKDSNIYNKKTKSTSQKTFYKSKYFRIAVNNLHQTNNLSLLSSDSYLKYNQNEFNINSKNSLHTIQIKLVNVEKRFFYGFINYIYKYESFKCSAFTFFIYLVSNIRKMIFKKQKIINSITTSSSNKNSQLMTIEISFNFLIKSLNFILRNLSSLNKNEILADLSYIRYVKSFKIIGLNLIENDLIIRAWSSIVLGWLNKKVMYEGYCAYFSTLGGAYSCLGEESYEHALNAEKTSTKQLILAIAFNDPNAICRCKMFLSFSYIQLRKFKQANFILKNEYEILKSEERSKLAGITDKKLRIMCIAGLKKLRFSITHLSKYKK